MKLEQTAKYVGSDWWQWSVHLAATPKSLDRVASVTYFLHPTFPEPVVEVKNRKTKFRLSAGGWGGFMIQAQIKGKDGKLVKRTLQLELEYPSDVMSSKAKVRSETKPSVFVSHSAADAALADSLRRGLADQGVASRSSDDLTPGSVSQTKIAAMIDDTDALVAVISDPPSRWVIAEISEAVRQNKVVLPVVVGEARVPSSISGLRQLRIPLGSIVNKEVARNIAEALPTRTSKGGPQPKLVPKQAAAKSSPLVKPSSRNLG